jgi:hypothetical protein
MRTRDSMLRGAQALVGPALDVSRGEVRSGQDASDAFRAGQGTGPGWGDVLALGETLSMQQGHDGARYTR